ncbi:hypothetical protein B0I37DRAFT_389389 [Chaetomium sp. MPI-CAGE-AT-0009]|nr:hypothetical protein B0I37DRAFT_389389 [Chaetomium sp. MPI-CAGE-AT-0009]
MSPDRIDRHVSLSGDPFVCDICGQELTDDEPMVASDPGPDVPSTRIVSNFSCATALPMTPWTGSCRRVPGAVCPGPAPPSRIYGCSPSPRDVLPHVVIGTILEWLPRDDCFWRCVTAMHMAKSLSVATVQPLRIVPLSWLVSWERGSPPKVASEEAVEDLPSFVRFTIDRDGLSKVERLADRAHFNRERFDDRVFVVEREDAFGPSLAIFKLPVWDTPTPPDFTHCLVKPERHPSMFRYHSIDLAAVTGITFFIYCSDTLGVHSHSRAHPCAMATYQQHRRKIPNLDQYCSWVYVPLPPGDTRALGDCRLYVDASAIFERPSRIAILNPTGYGEGVEVLFDELPPADEMIPNEADQISWSYYKMTGTLDFWFSSSRDQISVRGGTPIPREELLEEVREG